MADFTDLGNELNKHRDVVLFPWTENQLAVNARDGNSRQTTNQNWHAEIGGFYYQNGGMDVELPPFDLSHVDGDIVIMGHGNYGDKIAKDSGYLHSARSLAKVLADNHLPLNFGNKIVLWSCFAGAPGGMAQSLAFKLSGRGYRTLSVWGCKWVTGNIANKTFLCVPNTSPTNVAGNPVPATLADMVSY